MTGATQRTTPGSAAWKAGNGNQTDRRIVNQFNSGQKPARIVK